MSLGLDVIGADYGQILSTVFSAAGGAIDYAKAAQQEKDAAHGADNALASAIAADQAATSAVTKAKLSVLTKSSTAKADKAAADKAVSVQDTAGASLPEEKRPDRVKAAQDAVDFATKKVQSASGSMKVVAQAGLDAAKQTLAKAKGEIKMSGTTDGGGEEGFFAKKLVGPFKVGHAVVVGITGVVIGVLFAAFKKSHNK